MIMHGGFAWPTYRNFCSPLPLGYALPLRNPKQRQTMHRREELFQHMYDYPAADYNVRKCFREEHSW